MKNLITVFLIAFSTLAFGNNTPEVLITDDAVSVELNDSEFASHFTSATYNAEESKIEFETIADVNMIQIFNADGELEFQLPVMSNRVSISKELFSKGTSQLGFMMAGTVEVQFTTVSIK